jgi:hypothetical protein
MKRLIVGAVISYDLDKMDISPDDYDLDEVIEMLRREMEDTYSALDVEVEIRDYLVEEDGYGIDWG